MGKKLKAPKNSKKKTGPKGLDVKAAVNETSSVEREVTITIAGDSVAKELDKAYRKLGGEVRLKGYRQGKVPRYVLEQYYKEDTERRVLELLLRDSFQKAITDQELKVVADPQIDRVPEIIPGIDFTYVAKVEVKPEFHLEKVEGLPVKKTVFGVSDEDVDKHVEMLRDRQVKVIPVEDRDTIQQGDLVECNFSGAIDGETVRGLGGVSYVVEVGAGRFYAEAEQAMVGKKVDEPFEIEVTIPDDHRVAAARGKQALLKIRPMEIKQKIRPEVNDEFVQDIFEDLETVQEMRDTIREQLEASAKARTDAQLKEAVLDALIENNPFDVPPALVKAQAQRFAMETLQRMPRQHAERLWNTQHERLTEEARPKALKSVRTALILEKLVDTTELTVSDEEIEEKVQQIAAEVGQTPKTIRSFYARQGDEELKRQTLSDKVLLDIAEKAELEQVDESLPLVAEIGL